MGNEVTEREQMISFNGLSSVGANETQNLNTPSTSTGTAPSKSGETALPLVNSQRKLELIELAKKLGVFVEQLESIVNKDPSFLNKSFEEQQKFVQAKFEAQPEVVETEQEKPQSPQAKIISALAQNFYELGIKDGNGKVIQGFNANGAGSWAQLTDAQKAEFIQRVETELKNSKLVAQLDEKFNKLFEEIKKNEGEEVAQNIGNNFTNEVLLNIKAATFSGVSINDFEKMSKAEKASIIEKYLTKNEDLTDYEKNRLSRDNEIKNNAINYLRKLGFDIPENSNIGDVYGYLDNLNLSYEGVEYWTLKRKNKTSSLTPDEKARFDSLAKIFETDSGEDILKEQKAANLPNLEAKFAELQKKVDAGIKLSSEEQLQYDMLKQTLNSEETAELRKIELPKPQNEYQQEIYNQVEAFNNRFEHIGDSSRKAQLAKDFIERRTAGMTPEQKKEFIVNYLKFATKDGYAVELQRLYSVGNNAIDFSDSKEVYSLTAVNSDLLNTSQLESLKILTENMAKSKNKREQWLAANGYKTIAQGLEERGNDNLSSSWVNTGITVAENTKDSSVLISSTSLNMTIKDADLQLQNRNNIAASDVYNNDVARFELDNLNRYHAQNRLPILDNVTEGNAEMTAYAAENGAVTKLAVKDQVEGFNLLNDRVNEFIDQGVLTTDSLKNLADQIVDCDRTNQLAMHEKIMESKYTEVQEHAASNINKYDPTVQNAALEKAYETQKASVIAKAIASSEKFAQPDVKKIEQERAAEYVEKIFKERFTEGTLTSQEIAQLTGTQKREYYNLLFKNADPARKIELLEQMGGAQKEVVYTYIALYDPALFRDLVVNCKGTAVEILSVCNDGAVRNKVMTEVFNSGNEGLIKEVKDFANRTSGQDDVTRRYDENEQSDDVAYEPDSQPLMTNPMRHNNLVEIGKKLSILRA